MPVYDLSRGRKQAGQPLPAKPPVPAYGVGSELKAMIGWLSHLRPPGKKCGCDARAAEMDRRGVDWCDANRSTIIDWLRMGATELELPIFHELPARYALDIAIRRTRARDSANAASPSG